MCCGSDSSVMQDCWMGLLLNRNWVFAKIGVCRDDVDGLYRRLRLCCSKSGVNSLYPRIRFSSLLQGDALKFRRSQNLALKISIIT